MRNFNDGLDDAASGEPCKSDDPDYGTGYHSVPNIEDDRQHQGPEKYPDPDYEKEYIEHQIQSHIKHLEQENMLLFELLKDLMYWTDIREGDHLHCPVCRQILLWRTGDKKPDQCLNEKCPRVKAKKALEDNLTNR